MINVFKRIFLIVVVFAGAIPLMAFDSIYLFDNSFSIANPQGSADLSARWGTWDGSTFIQAVDAEAGNLGYAELASPELSVNLSQSNNAIYAIGTTFALAIFTDGSINASTLEWGAESYAAILTDVSWMAPAFDNTAPGSKVFMLSSSTIAVKGGFSYNYGDEIITLSNSAVPEPATFAMLFGAVVLGFSGCRRRRIAC